MMWRPGLDHGQKHELGGVTFTREATSSGPLQKAVYPIKPAASCDEGYVCFDPMVTRFVRQRSQVVMVRNQKRLSRPSLVLQGQTSIPGGHEPSYFCQ